MSKIKISVIVSIYNHGLEYLEKCLESLHNQNLKEEIEFILVDNGATKPSKNLINEYEKKDNRFKIIHFEKNLGYAKALNEGIKLAQGEYIAIVESDDFVASYAYEKLYNQITKFDADCCIAGFYIYNNGNIHIDHLHNKQIFSNIDDTKPFSIFDYPFLLTCHPSIWAKLYRASFLKNIQFCEQGRYIDSQFIVDLFCRTNKIIGHKEPIYYYRDDNPNASSTNKRNDSSLIRIIDDWSMAKETLKKFGHYEKLKEEFYYQASKAGYRFYKNIKQKYRKEFYQKWKAFVAELKNDPSYSFKYMNNEQKEFIRNLLIDNYKGTLKYIPKNSGYSRLLKNIFSVKNHSDAKHKQLTILGIKIKIKRKKKKDVVSDAMLREIASLKEFIYQTSYIPQKVAALHQQVFPQYRNKHRNDCIAIVGCGPTLNFYNPLQNAVHISLNRAIRCSNINFEYAFIWDLPGTKVEEPEFIEEFLNYDCTKFVGMFLHDNVPSPMELNYPHKGILHRCFSASRAGFGIPTCDPVIHQDISIFPLADFMSISFGALNFATYTNPKKIYLVGLDTKQAPCYDGKEHKYFMNDLLRGYKLFKTFVERYYPQTEVISINPVGLKGMFKDVYTQSYVDAHPELLNENIEIINEKELINI